jgi:hypothetical protein
MSKTSSEIILEWRPDRIWTIRFQADYAMLRTVEVDTINLKFQNHFEVFGDENKVVVESLVKALSHEEDLVSLHIRIAFDVKMDDFQRKDRQIRLPVPLIQSLAEHSYHILQGIWFAKIEGTQLEEFVLPLVPDEVLSRGVHQVEKTDS